MKIIIKDESQKLIISDEELNNNNFIDLELYDEEAIGKDNPRGYKLGTKVRIDGKTYECGDRTAQWVDGRWDIFLGYGIEAYHLALQNGLKTKIVEIL